MIRVRYVALLLIGALILCAMAQPAAIAKHGGHDSSDSTGDSEKNAKSDSRLVDYLISAITDHISDDDEETNDEEEDDDSEEKGNKRKPSVTPSHAAATPAPTPAATPEPALVTGTPKPAPASASASTPAPAPAPVSSGAFSSPPLSVSYLELNPPPLPSESGRAQSSGNSSQNYSGVKTDIMLPGAALLDAVNLPHWKANVSAPPPASRGLDLPAGAILLLILACAALVSYMAYIIIWKGQQEA